MQMLRALLLLTLLLANAAAGVRAQDRALPGVGSVPEPAPAAKDDDGAPTAIAIPDIPDRADADERYAEGVLALAAVSRDGSAALARRLDAIDASVKLKTRLFRYDDLKMLPVARLESLERFWAFEARRFADLRADLHDASAPYADATAELGKRIGDWQATRSKAGEGGIGQALVARSDGLIALLQRAGDTLSAPLQKQIQLGRRANALDAQITAAQKSVAAAIAYSDRRLMYIDSPPLWTLHLHEQATGNVLASTKLGLDIEGRFLAEYLRADTGNRRVLHVFMVVLFPLLAWLWLRNRRQLQSAPGPVADSASQRVLRRPLSSWLLLTMLGILVLEPDAPLLLHQMAMLLALVPLLRLLPPESKPLLGPWPYAATGLFLLNRVAFFLLANTFLYRWYYFGLTLLALAVTGWLLWRSRNLRSEWLHGHAGRLAHAATWVALGVLLVSALANLLGNVTLAEMLTGGLIDSGYTALVLFAGVTVFIALLGQVFPQSSMAKLRIAREHAPQVMALVSRLLVLAAVLGWLAYTANRFRLFRPAYAFAHGVLTHEFSIGELSISLGAVLVFIVGIFLAFWSARLMRFVLREEVLPRLSLPRGVDNSVASLTYYALLLVGLVGALAAAGFEIGQLTFLFGALGVGIGFGLQNVVNNFVSGLILMFERPIQPGDVVDVSGTSGRVSEIGMRATTIKTFDGADVVVPNGTLLSEKLTNWTLRDMHRRLDIDVGVAYGSAPDQVAELLLKTVRETPGVAEEPAPAVLFTGFGASSLDFGVRAWTQDFDNWVQLRSSLATRLYAALVQAGIEIPFPQQDLHVRSVSDVVVQALRQTGANKGRGPRPAQSADDGSPAG